MTGRSMASAASPPSDAHGHDMTPRDAKRLRVAFDGTPRKAPAAGRVGRRRPLRRHAVVVEEPDGGAAAVAAAIRPRPATRRRGGVAPVAGRRARATIYAARSRRRRGLLRAAPSGTARPWVRTAEASLRYRHDAAAESRRRPRRQVRQHMAVSRSSRKSQPRHRCPSPPSKGRPKEQQGLVLRNTVGRRRRRRPVLYRRDPREAQSEWLPVLDGVSYGREHGLLSQTSGVLDHKSRT